MTWQLHHGDCLDPVSGLASLPDRSVEHVITDPPYSEHTERNFVLTTGGAPHKPGLGAVGFFSAADIERVASQLARVSRRWILVFCDQESAHLWADSLGASGAAYVRTGRWIRLGGTPQLTGDRPAAGDEAIVICHAAREAGRMRWNGGGRTALYQHAIVRGDERRGHPTPKPIDLMLALVRDFTDPGETILDPFAGSGTTGAACIQLGRSFIGWERDANYHAVASKRLSAVREQPSLFGERVKRAKTVDMFGTKATDGTDGAAVLDPFAGSGTTGAAPCGDPGSLPDARAGEARDDRRGDGGEARKEAGGGRPSRG